MVDGAGGRTQLSLIVSTAIVLLVLLFLTEPLAYMPEAGITLLRSSDVCGTTPDCIKLKILPTLSGQR